MNSAAKKTIRNTPVAKTVENTEHKEKGVSHPLQLKTKVQTAEAKRRKMAKERLTKKAG